MPNPLRALIALCLLSPAFAADDFLPLHAGAKPAAAAPAREGCAILSVELLPRPGAFDLRFTFDRPVAPADAQFRLYLDADDNTHTGRADASAHKGTDHYVVLDKGKLSVNSYLPAGKAAPPAPIKASLEKDTLVLSFPFPPLTIDAAPAVRMNAALWLAEDRASAARLDWAVYSTAAAPAPPPAPTAPKARMEIPVNFRPLSCYDQRLPRDWQPETLSPQDLATYKRIFAPKPPQTVLALDAANPAFGLDLSACGLAPQMATRGNQPALRLRGSRRDLKAKGTEIALPAVTLQPGVLYELRLKFHFPGALWLTTLDPHNTWGDAPSGVYADAAYSDDWRVANFPFPNFTGKPLTVRFVISLRYALEEGMAQLYDLPLDGPMDLWIADAHVERLGVMPHALAANAEFHPYHGLLAHVSRGMVKPTEALRLADGSFPSERLDFTDTVTGATVWKMTHDMYDSWHTYPNVPPWNCAGDRFVFSSVRPVSDRAKLSMRYGAKFVMAADGSFIRPLTDGEYKWDARRPDLLHREDGPTPKTNVTAVQVDPATGRILKEWDWFQLAPFSPDSKVGMLGPPHPLTGKMLIKEACSSGSARHTRFFAVDPPAAIPADPGAPPSVVAPAPVLHLPFPTNQFYWTKDEFSAFEFNFNPTSPVFDDPSAGRRGQYRVDFLNGRLYRFCKVHGSHRSYEGATLGRRMARVSGGLLLRAIASDDERALIARPPNPYGVTDAHTDASSLDGTLGSSLGTSYFLADMKPWPLKSEADTPGVWGWARNIHRLVVMAHRNRMYRSEAHAALSPDGAKLAFMSNMTGQVEVYHALIRRPRPPRDLALSPAANGVRLTWRPPQFSREITGYLIFTSAESGRGWRLAAPQPVTGTVFDDTAPDAPRRFYAVCSLEGSGQASILSSEATLETAAPRRLFFGLLDSAMADGMARRLDALASERAGVGLSALRDQGAALLRFNLPRKANWRFFVRARHENAAPADLAFSLNGSPAQSAKLTPTAGYAWTPLPLSSGPLESGSHDLWLSPTAAPLILDSVCASDDPAFVPAGAALLPGDQPAPPAGLRAQSQGDFTNFVDWRPSPDPLVTRYNVYCAGGRDFLTGQPIAPPVTRDNRCRVATVFRPAHADWGLSPGQEYHYAVTAVNRFDVESDLSEVFTTRTPSSDPVLLRQTAGQWPAVVEFTVPRPGRYVLWARTRSEEKSPARRARIGATTVGAVQLDDGAAYPWRPRFDLVSWGHAGPDPDQPFWDLVSLNHSGHYPAAELTPGQRRFTFQARGDWKWRVEELILTDDLSYRPPGVVNFIWRP